MMSTFDSDFEPMMTTTTEIPAPDDPDLLKCNYFVTKNQSIVFEFTNQYGGIPQNLAFNLIGWAILMLLFSVLRRAAGNYGRLALVRKENTDEEAKWTQLFFAPDDLTISTVNIVEDDARRDDVDNNHDHSIDYSAEEVVEDRRVCAWIASIFTLTDEQFLRKCGTDAVQYLRFQRHLIAFVAVITLTCVGIILPINFQGELQGTTVDFGHTTISNLKGTDNRLWVHIVLVILFLPLGIAIMRHFSVHLGIRDESGTEIASRTLMIVGVPDTYCTKEFLLRHLNEAYNNTSFIQEVQIAYDVSKLSWLDCQRETAKKARIYCENYATKHGAGQQMKPLTCGILCMCCCNSRCCPNSVDALTFYRKEEMHYEAEVQREKARIKTKSIGIAFVTFTSKEEAKKVLDEHSNKLCFSNPPASTLSNLLEPWNWSIRIAPPPDDIYWENLTDTHRLFFLKTLCINIVVFIILFFFTSPAYIISQLELILNLKSVTKELPEKINDFLPTLMLWTLSALLPIIVAYSDWWMGHWRRSVENLWIMRKVFFYLLFMVLILPSIGLTSLRGLMEMFLHAAANPDFNNHNSTNLQWNCIFLPDNGAFFVNYVITSALVGTALEFMRFSELFMYALRMMVARSVAETPSVRAANLYEFPFGFNYGWILLVFALTVAYGVVCPLITPFGLFYLVMKHGVDRYNLYYAYKRSKINKNIHATAVNCVIVSLLIQQLILLFFNTVRGSTAARSIFSITMFSIFLILFVAQMFFHVFKGISPIQYTYNPTSNNSEDNRNQEEQSGSGVLSDDNGQQRQNERPFIGFCNPEVTSDQVAFDLQTNTTGSTTRRRRRRRGQKQFLPDVLREPEEDVNLTRAHEVFANENDSIVIDSQHTDNVGHYGSPLRAYGSTDMPPSNV